MNIELSAITKRSSRHEKRVFLKYMNKFRANYFADAPDMDMSDINYALDNKIVCMLIVADNKYIGAVEATPGCVITQKILNIATIFIDKQFRNKGIANFVYAYLDNLLPDVDVALQIEESNYYQNISKFKNMGFTHYWAGDVSSNDHRQYNEKTFVLYSEKYDNQLMPIAEVA